MTAPPPSGPARFAMALALSATGLVAGTQEPDAATSPRGFVPLFNGVDLTGWTPVNTAPSTWSVRDGMLHCTGKPTGELRTERMYHNFVLEVEWRHMVPKGNAGIFVWADDITSKGVPFHRSIEVQVLENAYGNTKSHTTHGDIFPIHGAAMTPVNGRGGSRAFPTANHSRPSPEWNHYRITCNDGEIALAVNGVEVTRGTACLPRKGYICLESEGGVVDYRNVRIRELPDTPIDPEHIAIANRGFTSLYTGVDLSGWVQGNEDAAWSTRDWVLHGEPGAVLTTTSRRGDFGFVVDARGLVPGAASDDAPPQPLDIWLRGTASTALPFHAPQVLAGLSKGWNRLEGEVRGNQLTLRINGREVLHDAPLFEDSAPREGPLTLRASEALDLANLFVRPL